MEMGGLRMRTKKSQPSVQVAVRQIQGEWSVEEREARLLNGVERQSELMAMLFNDCADDEYR